ncbi:MAG TPA: glycosyltransferase family 4 protein, partial [Actinomycetota bacterium]|nr:glycosyltransferase family 4 protein [Actinomycetota bacterium]
MKILLWHGYLMSGSGSNVYTANVSAAWRRKGHDVLIMCQEADAGRFDFVDRFATIDGDASGFSWNETSNSPGRGRCSVVRPDIRGLLPVYVYDEYEGFDVKLFVDLSDDELDGYTQRNVRAMATVLRLFDPDAVITGHEVMGPYIARAACESTRHSYIAKLHGSALEYAVKRQPRYLRYATEGLGAARRVVGGSSYMLDEAASVIPGWRDKALVVNPGADIHLFRPAPAQRSTLATIGFVGKLIAEKGTHNLLAALSLVRADVRAVIVGYGGDEAAIKQLHEALACRDAVAARRAAGELSFSHHIEEFLAGMSRSAMDRYARIPLEFTGRLDHGPLARVLPRFDVLVVPSIVPEAFGMVAAEAAACGILPIVPDHSGIAEAGRAVEEAIGMTGLLTYDATRPIESIAAAIDRVLMLPPAERTDLGLKAAQLARALVVGGG